MSLVTIIRRQQRNYMSKLLKPQHHILVNAVAGSHLFGLNTPKSDKDFKGVYIPTLEELLLGEVQDSVHHSTNTQVNTKNNSDDVDTEFYSLAKFFRMLEQGQTVALELLFTPLEFQLQTSEIWLAIQKEASRLVHKQVTAYLGYARQQADKYGLRGSRMGSIESVITTIESTYEPFDRLEDIKHTLVELTKLQHVSFIDKYLDGREYFCVCSKKFDLRTRVSQCLESLKATYDEYGARSRQAKLNDGIDWKALSHAVRVMYQGQELLNTGKMTLPLKPEHREVLMKIKLGELDYPTTVQPLIESEMDKLVEAETNSSLPNKIHTNQMLLDIYKQHFNLTN